MPHAFSNPGAQPARMLFLVSPAGYETYLQEVTDLRNAPGHPDHAEITALRLRHDIRQLTPLTATTTDRGSTTAPAHSGART
ncbi:hypothetical protein [Streptomyces sp. NPDC002156]